MTPFESSNGLPLPNDLVVQILARLPVKSLFRCRSVCKFWCRLPSDHHFIQLHSQFSAEEPMVLVETVAGIHSWPTYVCVDRHGGWAGFSLNFLKDRVKVRASCNGLLCCASILDRGVYYICNPMTREFRLLPRARERHISRYRPNYEATLVGLAYKPSTRKLNVALAGFYRPFGHRPLGQLVCFIYDSETNVWSRFVSAFYDEFTHLNRNQVVFASGSLHWLTSSCSYLLVLNLEKRVWVKIALPDMVSAREAGSRIYLFELEGSVAVVQILGTSMCIWVLKDYINEEWDMVERVHLRCILAVAANVFPVCLSRDLIFMATQKKVLLYGRKDKLWKEIYAAKDSFTYPLWFSANSFRSTLFPCSGNIEIP